ncbi:protein phosphatase 2C domain-containing protein [Luteipulveratus mongoliensis]|uniref:Serine/threonine protein phosphatase n=1 Tax=Luteipulveratus mongoliensis TaxID=571913 RepID=A0A0K1JR27_9MICO|nr:protein phosphatase 2C domain-containing protein [Luteipulveratus mongoliensis]AKU19176.1 serine/threonine protein phosphatase [Luteipulveratus mongoliensis]
MSGDDAGSVSAGTTVRCPACGHDTTEGDLFCEACGAELASAPTVSEPVAAPLAGPTAPISDGACLSCGGVVGEDGYCETCGTKAPKPRDHFQEQPAPWVAMTCDRGVRHHRNEDAGALSADPEPGSRAVLVVCDGVSSSTDSDVASLAAASAARDVLAVGRAQGMGTPSSRVSAIVARLEAAATAANDAVVATTAPESGSPASCTFVAAVVDDGTIVAGSVGDSRAYWFPDSGEAIHLSVDDSMAAELIAQGTPRQIAESSPQAHAITRWLGVDSHDHKPGTMTVDVDAPGWLLVCSDGLWNYCSAAADLADLVRRTASAQHDDPLATSAALVDWANAQGGQDNITVALARIPIDGRI